MLDSISAVDNAGLSELYINFQLALWDFQAMSHQSKSSRAKMCPSVLGT